MMLTNFDKWSKWGLALGVVLGVAGFFVFERLLFSILLGTFVAALVTRRDDWAAGARYTALVGAVLAVIYVTLFQYTNLDGLASISFKFLDHVLYLLVFGGLGCALVGVMVGTVTTSIRSLIPPITMTANPSGVSQIRLFLMPITCCLHWESFWLISTFPRFL